MLQPKQITAFSERTIGLAQQQVAAGGLPFSSIIVNQQGDVIGEGVNQVTDLHDCTAHAEIQAIRCAGANVGSAQLSGATLFASGEPCGLCYAAIRLANISQVVVLLDRYEVKALGFDYLWTYQPVAETTPSIKVTTLTHAHKAGPFLKCQQGLDAIGL